MSMCRINDTYRYSELIIRMTWDATSHSIQYARFIMCCRRWIYAIWDASANNVFEVSSLYFLDTQIRKNDTFDRYSILCWSL